MICYSEFNVAELLLSWNDAVLCLKMSNTEEKASRLKHLLVPSLCESHHFAALEEGPS